MKGKLFERKLCLRKEKVHTLKFCRKMEKYNEASYGVLKAEHKHLVELGS